MENYNYHNDFIFRTPQLPLDLSGLTKEELFRFSQQPFFKEAIYIASPVLYTELIKWHNNELKEEKEQEKLATSLYKYYVRMQSRCTPYGLFAACGSGSWGDESKIKLSDKENRHTRLDMNYLCALAQQLNSHPVLMPRLRFFPNNSTYHVGETMRYVEYSYVNNRRVHQITSVQFSTYLERVLKLAENGARLQDLAATLVSDEITSEEAEDFIKELIQSQLLISELEPAVTGDEFSYQLIHTLKKLNEEHHPEIEQIIQILESTQAQINKLDREENTDAETYRSIYKQLQELKTPIEENQLFQTDLFRSTQTATLNKSIQKRLSEAITFLNKFSAEVEQSNLKKFKENFYNQYEHAELPLLHVLDTETGIGYTGKDSSGVNKLLDDLYIPGKPATSYDVKWNRKQEFLQSRLLKALKEGQYSVDFKDEDVKDSTNTTNFLPDSLAVMFRVVDDEKIYLQSCGGSSAANLLGRFAHGDHHIHHIIKTITAHEQELDPDKILAEIVHLPESRIGNILLRPVLRDYEIPYLGKSALPVEQQIQLQDLMVSVQNDKIILRSKRLNKEIIPRLSTAHNYTFNALPVYQFLCDLQTQYFDKSGVGFNWGSLVGNYKFLPRATYKNVILERAKWQLKKEDVAVLLNDKPSKELINTWRKHLNLPEQVALVDGDNELLINFKDEQSVSMFLSSIKKRESFILEEFLFNEQALFIKDEDNKGYVNEFIAMLLKDKIAAQKIRQRTKSERETITNTEQGIQRNFSIGSEWLYYKFYSGIKTADKLLAEVIRPLTQELVDKNYIDKFFFIRYSDPDNHIRLRFHFADLSKIGLVIGLVYKAIQPYQEQGLISKIQTDTYARELERYGTNSMELTESLFYIDSIVTLNLLDLIDGEEGEIIRWQFAIRSMDDLLTNLKFSAAEKLQLLDRMKTSFFREHGESKELKLQLDAKFRTERKLVEDILNKELDERREIQPVIELLKWKDEQVQPLAEQLLELKRNNQLQIDLNELTSSYIHMLLNRLFMARQ
ncbi:MAG TPA: lantibiotic dehydratase, partial [Bacteroidia bacterium]|nr:lantibiotic dehydratase [Bacteroidia bacterium]